MCWVVAFKSVYFEINKSAVLPDRFFTLENMCGFWVVSVKVNINKARVFQ